MSFKTKALVAALVLAAIGSANATLKFGNGTTNGNSSLAFVAMSGDGSTSLVVDLGYQMTDLLVGGALRAAGDHTATWNLSTGAVTLDGAARAGTYAYANAASFLSTFSSATNTNSIVWGVIAADSVGGATSATNLVNSQNIVFTSSALDFDNSATGIKNATVSNGATNVSNLFAANNTVAGTSNTAGKFGSSTATAGDAWLGKTMAADGVTGDFGQQLATNSFLVALTDTAYVMRAQLNTTTAPTVSQLGGVADSVGAALDVNVAAKFTFDEASSTLTYTVATVPEASTYAMLMAGLGAVSFMARRRRSAR